MSNDREGWLKPERPKPWTADGYIVRDANGAGFAECPTRADAQMIAALAALDAPVADEGPRERTPDNMQLWINRALKAEDELAALHATPATTQGREAELREAAEYAENWKGHTTSMRGKLARAFLKLYTPALATPKPVEAPAQTGSEDVFCDNCGRAPGLASARRCHKCAEPDHATKPEATTDLCAKCGKPSGAPIHFWLGGESAHRFTPAPKEHRP